MAITPTKQNIQRSTVIMVTRHNSLFKFIQPADTLFSRMSFQEPISTCTSDGKQIHFHDEICNESF